MKHIFTYKNRHYGYKVVYGNVETYEILEVHDEEENEKLKDEDWEYIFKYFGEREKEL